MVGPSGKRGMIRCRFDSLRRPILFFPSWKCREACLELAKAPKVGRGAKREIEFFLLTKDSVPRAASWIGKAKGKAKAAEMCV